MLDKTQTIINQFQSIFSLTQEEGWEFFAVICLIGYVILAARQQRNCWILGFIGASIYTILFLHYQLYFSSVLQLYYMGISIYGWYQWKTTTTEQTIQDLSLKTQIIIALPTTIITYLIIVITETWFDPQFPYLDAFITSFSLVATYYVTQKYLVNWLYWLVLNIAAIMLYWQSELYITVALFSLYSVLAVYGYFSWKKNLQHA